MHFSGEARPREVHALRSLLQRCARCARRGRSPGMGEVGHGPPFPLWQAPNRAAQITGPCDVLRGTPRRKCEAEQSALLTERENLSKDLGWAGDRLPTPAHCVPHGGRCYRPGPFLRAERFHTCVVSGILCLPFLVACGAQQPAGVTLQAPLATLDGASGHHQRYRGREQRPVGGRADVHREQRRGDLHRRARRPPLGDDRRVTAPTSPRAASSAARAARRSTSAPPAPRSTPCSRTGRPRAATCWCSRSSTTRAPPTT